MERDRQILGQARGGRTALAGLGDADERSGRHVYVSPEELTEWVGTEAGKSRPVRIAMDRENLLADFKEGLAYVRRGKGGRN